MSDLDVSEPSKALNAAQRSADEIFALAKEERQQLQKVRAEQAKSVAAIPRDRIYLIAVAIGMPILIALLLFNVIGLSLTTMFETPPSPTAARQDAQRTLDTLVADIETFRKDYKELPESLVEIGKPKRGTWTYRPSGAHFRIQGSYYGQNVSYDSATAPRASK